MLRRGVVICFGVMCWAVACAGSDSESANSVLHDAAVAADGPATGVAGRDASAAGGVSGVGGGSDAGSASGAAGTDAALAMDATLDGDFADACSVMCSDAQDAGVDDAAEETSCERLDSQYRARVAEAKSCAPQSPSCTTLVGSTLECMCGTLVNGLATEALAAMQRLTERYYALGCQWTVACDCAMDPTRASCDAASGGGVCVDRFD